MGLRILHPSGELIVIQPFALRELKNHTVQLWCNVQTSEHNLVYAKPRQQNTQHHSPQLVVEFSVSVFRSMVLTERLKEFSKKIKTKRAQIFSTAALPLNAAMHQCIYNITHYAGAEETKSLYMYARTVDLLLMQQECYVRTTLVRPAYVKTEYDKERIIFARDYLLTHMDAPPTLSQLAAIAGINAFKLKRGFRELFNHSVFGYLADVRLEMARTALLQKQKTVTQIAFELGYASLQHFSAAFKKKFGVPPVKYS
jgi:AraC family transcriptional regulator, transcriptional activator of the genes for pyochelin and ferripyochelin receptors